jgi:ATP-binding cassette subfamily B protein
LPRQFSIAYDVDMASTTHTAASGLSARHAAPSATSGTKAPVGALGGLRPFLWPYRWQIAWAAVFLLGAAITTLVVPIALRSLVDAGLMAADTGQRVMALREHFLALFGVGVALGVLSAARFYMVSWIGERVTTDLRSAVYDHVVRLSPAFFERTAVGEVLSRLTTDTTVVQTVVGSSLSLGLRNTVMGLGAMTMLIITNPWVMSQVLGILVLVILPALLVGRRAQTLPRQPGPHCRHQRHCRRGALRHPGSAGLRPGRT